MCGKVQGNHKVWYPGLETGVSTQKERRVTDTDSPRAPLTERASREIPSASLCLLPGLPYEKPEGREPLGYKGGPPRAERQGWKW